MLLQGRREMVDEYWLHILLALIGESFEDTDEVLPPVLLLYTEFCLVDLWCRRKFAKESE